MKVIKIDLVGLKIIVIGSKSRDGYFGLEVILNYISNRNMFDFLDFYQHDHSIK